MPIRFPCDGCHQRLSIARRKAGAQIVCPVCGKAQTVPNENGDSGLIDLPVETDSSSSDTGLDLSADLLPDEPSACPSFPLPAAAEAIDIAPSIRLVSAAAPQPLEILPPPPPISRQLSAWAVYCQALILAAVGIGGFAGGYYLGRQDGSALPVQLPLAAAAAAAPAPGDGFRDEEVLLQGRMLWMPTFGQAAGDGQSVLLLLPRDKIPGQSLPIGGLRPADEPAADASSAQQLQSLGGIHVRAAADGTVAAVLPREGRYHLLLISRNTLRPKEQPIRARDLAEMKQYFAEAEQLVGDQKYVWKEAEIRVGNPPIEHDFGLDGLP
ncbi:MAG: hypothetical protein GXY25_12170 [Pirellulaceae bacterium]|nr:hypothetical protein [Pirellulaceae bacterium]